jgi:hypothetical protein
MRDKARGAQEAEKEREQAGGGGERPYTTRTQLPVIFFPGEKYVIQVKCVTFPNYVRPPRATTFFFFPEARLQSNHSVHSLG